MGPMWSRILLGIWSLPGSASTAHTNRSCSSCVHSTCARMRGQVQPLGCATCGSRASMTALLDLVGCMQGLRHLHQRWIRPVPIESCHDMTRKM